MVEGLRLREALKRWGRPAPGPSLLQSLKRTWNTAALLLPVVAVAFRLTYGIPSHIKDAGLLFAAAWAGAFVYAAFRYVSRRPDPIAAAKAVDRALDGQDRVLSAAESLDRGREGAMVSLLIADAEERLGAISSPERVSPRPVRLWTVGFVFSLLFFLALLFVPTTKDGLFGVADVADDKSDVKGDVEGVDGAGDKTGAPKASALGAKVSFQASSDARLYALNQEINLTLELRADEPLPPNTALRVLLGVNGADPIPLPIAWVLPAVTGESVKATVPLRDRLKAAGLYRRGLLTFEAFAFPEVESKELRGPAVSNRVLVQVSENQKNLKSKMPSPAKKEKKPKSQKKPKKNPERRPDETPKKKSKKTPEPQAVPKAPGPPPPEEIAAKKRVIDPLFSGDQKSKRKTRIYDRDEEKADPRSKPPTPKERARSYQPAGEVPTRRGIVSPKDRDLVRRYFEKIRPKSDKK